MFLMMEDNVQIYVKKSGNGIPCLFIHGGPGEGSLDFETFGGKDLEPFVEMIYYDQRGCARSGGTPENNYSIDKLCEDIEEIRKNLGISKWIVMAHSFGGIIAINYAYKYEEVLQGLILLNVTLNMDESFKSQIEYGVRLLPKEGLEDTKYTSVLEKWQVIASKLVEKDLYYKLQYDKYENYLTLEKVNNEISNFNGTMAGQAFENKEYFSNFFSLTEKINIPVMIIAGDEDYAVGPKHHEAFNFQNKTLKLVHGKHMIYLENKEEFIASIKELVQDIK